MIDRLELKELPGEGDIAILAFECLKELTGKGAGRLPTSLASCCELLRSSGAVSAVIQRRVLDPDFLAEYGAYYSRQFAVTEKYCTRIHFFIAQKNGDENVLEFLDRAPLESYLGFVTLRPVLRSPVGASILQCGIVKGFVRSSDKFPVHIAGRQYQIIGTPFMQQDNAVGACAQASIWMSLRTLRKREGDRAHDPAQITDAATRYFINGRIRPNRQGLTLEQMVEAIRAAGYSPHAIPLGGAWKTDGSVQMTPTQVQEAMKTIHPYIESEIPVILLLFPPSGGHAVVMIGHTWDRDPLVMRTVVATCPSGVKVIFNHAASWVPTLLIHNDNSGPYLELRGMDPIGYSLQHGAYAIPLLPADVFMSAEEAMTLPLELLGQLFGGFIDNGTTVHDAQELGAQLAVRLSLVEKRKIRKWAASEAMSPEMKLQLRTMDLPKRLWSFELHKAADYGKHEHESVATLVGLILIDSTGDILTSSVMLMHINLPELNLAPNGVMLIWDTVTGTPIQAIQTTEVGLVRPLRH
jgi:hypothetical protein